MKITRIVLCLLFSSLCVAAQAANTPKLTGTIYDEYGALVFRAKITATGDGKTFTAYSDDNGDYTLTLPLSPYRSDGKIIMTRYNITVQLRGFKTSEIRGYAFASGQRGIMSLDVALEFAQPSADATRTSRRRH